MPFTSLVTVVEVDDKNWALADDLTYAGGRDFFVIPQGFVTDFASVPRAASWLLPRYGAYTKAAILHDFLWRTDAVSRRDADGLFRRAMRELGVPWPRRYLMWAAVRARGGMAGATARDWAIFVPVAFFGLAYILLPAVVVQAFLVLYWLIEAAIWVIGQLRGTESAQPTSPATTTE